jgi:hypothetical protein
MTDETLDRTRLRKKHYAREQPDGEFWCNEDSQDWPCDMSKALDEIERLNDLLEQAEKGEWP